MTTHKGGDELLKSRVAAANLYSPFKQKLVLLLDEASADGHEFWAISGFRSYDSQEALYAIGRSVDLHRQTVTNARAGESPHNFGLAVDLCKDAEMRRSGLQPDYMNSSYEPLKALCAKYGLVWGGNWAKPDRPHVQWPGFVTAAQLEPVREAFEAGGLLTAFDKIDELQGGASNGTGH